MSTIDDALICPAPDVTNPTSEPFGPFPGIVTRGLYHNPQPPTGWRPRLMSLAFSVKNTAGRYDVSLAPEWVAAFIPSVLAPKSVGDLNTLQATPGPLENPATHTFFFRLGAPNVEAKAQVYLANRGRGFVPPLDSTGRWWGLLVRANLIPIGGIVNISGNWTVEPDPRGESGNE